MRVNPTNGSKKGGKVERHHRGSKWGHSSRDKQCRELDLETVVNDAVRELMISVCALIRRSVSKVSPNKPLFPPGRDEFDVGYGWTTFRSPQQVALQKVKDLNWHLAHLQSV